MSEFKIEWWDKPCKIYPQGIERLDLGTIRTVPENYYVASIFKVNNKYELGFMGIEANTKNINQNKARRWFDEQEEKEGGKKMSKELKPCPFCGKDDGGDSYDRDGHHVIRCMNCGAVGPWAEQLYDAIELWNDREET